MSIIKELVDSPAPDGGRCRDDDSAVRCIPPGERRSGRSIRARRPPPDAPRRRRRTENTRSLSRIDHVRESPPVPCDPPACCCRRCELVLRCLSSDPSWTPARDGRLSWIWNFWRGSSSGALRHASIAPFDIIEPWPGPRSRPPRRGFGAATYAIDYQALCGLSASPSRVGVGVVVAVGLGRVAPVPSTGRPSRGGAVRARSSPALRDEPAAEEYSKQYILQFCRRLVLHLQAPQRAARRVVAEDVIRGCEVFRNASAWLASSSVCTISVMSSSLIPRSASHRGGLDASDRSSSGRPCPFRPRPLRCRRPRETRPRASPPRPSLDGCFAAKNKVNNVPSQAAKVRTWRRSSRRVRVAHLPTFDDLAALSTVRFDTLVAAWRPAECLRAIGIHSSERFSSSERV